ncbi:MAG: hypothetical protein R3C59_30460 [Planctomycetaceae bacterium]
MSSISPDRLKDADDLNTVPVSAARSDSDPGSDPDQPVVKPAICDDEAAELRAEKLAEIRRAIAAGAYDSDELLDKALRKMQESFRNRGQ